MFERAAARCAHGRCSIAATLLLCSSTLAPAAAASDQPFALFEQKLQLMEMLLRRTQARQDLGADARATLEIAETLVNVAREDLERGELETVKASLDESLRLIGEIARSSAEPLEEAARDGYEQLHSTLEGLRAAYLEAASRRGAPPDAVLDLDRMDHDVASAADLASSGRYQRALAALRRVYDPLVKALALMRANETVEHRLEFDSPQAEFEYESRRFDSTLVLLDLMVQEKAPRPATRKRIVELRQLAQQRFLEAQSLAGAGDVAAGIDRAEAAVRELNQALRQVGVFFAP
jgi:hypothetical protein